MSRAGLKDGVDLYRVILNRHETILSDRRDRYGDREKEVTDRIIQTDIEGPYGSKSAAKGRLTARTREYYHSYHSGKVQVVRNPKWEDVE